MDSTTKKEDLERKEQIEKEKEADLRARIRAEEREKLLQEQNSGNNSDE